MKRTTKRRTLKVRTNGQHAIDARSTISLPAAGIARILRPQAAYRWILPNLAAITPQYIELTLRGALVGDHVRQWELFDLMLDTWPELASVEAELICAVEKKKLIFEPHAIEDEKPSASAVEKMKTVSFALRSMKPEPAADENDMRGTITDILDGWFRGVTVLEVDWFVVSDNAGAQIVAPRATFWVHPTCFAFNADGVLSLRVNSSSSTAISPFLSFADSSGQQGLVPLPPNKFLVGIHKGKSGPALGGAILRPLAWWWCAANFSADWLLNLAQVFGLPFRWANYDQNAPQETVNRICDMLANMGSAGWAAFPAGTTLELKEPSKGGERSPQSDLLDRADRYARMLILGQTMSGGVTLLGKGGGQAFGTVEALVKDERVDAASLYAQEVINRQLIPMILQLNYGEETEPPRVRLLQEDEGGLEDAQRDAELVKMRLPIGINFLRKKYGIPEPAQDEETVPAPSPSSSSSSSSPSDESMQAKAADPEDITRYVADVLHVTPEFVAPAKSVIDDLIRKAGEGPILADELADYAERALRRMPELALRNDVSAVADALYFAMRQAALGAKL